MTRVISLWLGGIIGIGFVFASARAQSESITVQGIVPYNWPDGVMAPVVVPISAPPLDAGNLTAHVIIEGQSESKCVKVQFEPADSIAGTPDRAWFVWTADADDRGKAIAIRIKSDTNEISPRFYFRNVDPLLHLLGANDLLQAPWSNMSHIPVLRFWYGQPESGQKYPLTDFLHPIFGIDGEKVTDLRPADHIHHRGVFWAWPRYERQGKEIGAWWVPTNIQCEPDTIGSSAGPVFARFHSRHFLVHQPPDKDTGERFIREDLLCRAFGLKGFGQAIDVEIMMTALEPGVRIGGTTVQDKGYGGLTVRTAPADYATIEADGEFLPEDGIRHRAHWTDWNGYFKELAHRPGSGRSGIAVLVHPSHPDVPPEWLLRHYGILNVAYPGLEMLEIPTDEPLRLRYRLWIHRGNATQGRVDAQYRAYCADWKWRMRDRGTER